MADPKIEDQKPSTGGSAVRFLAGEAVYLLAPRTFAGLAAIAGVLVLAALMIPASLEDLPFDLPLGLLEVSHFVASIAGTLLILLSMGLGQRLHSAWLAGLIIIALLSVLTVLAGGHVGLAIFLALATVAMGASRHAFYRKGSISEIAVSPERVLLLVGLLAGVAWLGFFAYRNVQYRNDLWWTFALDADASRFLRALVTVAVTAALFIFWRLLQPRGAPGLPERTAELDEKISAVLSAPGTAQAEGALAYLDDKRFMFSEDGRAFVMYGVRGRNWIVMGPPVGPKDAAQTLAFAFKRFADRARANVIFYAVPASFLPVALDLGLVAQKVGETAIINLEDFTLEGSDRARLRQAVNKLKREDNRFEMLPPGAFDEHAEVYKSVSDAWLARHSGAEKAFTLGKFDEDYLRRFSLATIWKGDQLMAFANVWESGDRKTLMIDLMRHHPDAPSPVMDALFAELALWGRAAGFKRLDLGMAPLAGLATQREADVLSRLGAFVYSHGENVYGFEGLRRYKEKFHPDWEPVYLAAPGRMNIALALADVALLTSGGLRKMLGGK
ncbi:phosphatidylglycerol lysyltransferase domain-containing protein [Henriciella litoralis]|uniref:phosphatidylglycerol lysyltransferase domain-containing protein n=1 Tax=Henriciella litoralis TaxID=568102 RepID=UPI0009FC9878|nr:phosphatidylglycerol lysyltransferase domain-containing protein [Henriciella litoralis]